MIVRLAAVVVAALALAGPSAAACRAPDDVALVPRGADHVPDLPHDARPVRLAGRPAHRGADPAADRRSAGRPTRSRPSSWRNFGAGILAAPPHKGFDLLAWWLPLGGVIVGAGVLAFGVWRWSATRDDDDARDAGGPALDAADEERLDELLARLD